MFLGSLDKNLAEKSSLVFHILGGQPGFFTKHDGETERNTRISCSDENSDRSEDNRNKFNNNFSVRPGINAKPDVYTINRV